MEKIPFTDRLSFGRIKHVIDYPDFLDIQLESFNYFAQLDIAPDDRASQGLQRIFNENFPISDSRETHILEFVYYSVDTPKYNMRECQERGLTYAIPLKAKLRLSSLDDSDEAAETIEQEVFLGDLPWMTNRGTFVVNGAERVIVSQLHRSPGVFFGTSFHANGTQLYSARIIPFKGSWMEFTTDINNVMYAYIDRKKKLPITTLLRAVGYETDQDILEIFGLAQEIKATKTNLKKMIGRSLAARVVRSWVEDFVDEDTGEVVSIERTEVLIDRETKLEEQHIQMIVDAGIKSILVHKESGRSTDYEIIFNTLQKDTANSEKEAVEYIYRQLRNAEPPDEETARGIIDKLFFSEKRYDLGEVGRYRINKRLNLNIDNDTRILTKEDIISIIKYLVGLINNKTELDDIDHLSNRRVRTVGEQLYNQFGVGLARMARTIRERMNVRDNEVFTPIDLINSKTLSSVINSFFGTNQLSQFMDQTNPLGEMTHKRRMSALGPGGLSRERAGFEVRDVHYTHYGRLCPIETPEGPNIGLISSLCVYAKINDLGFIETPYRKVTDGKVDLSGDASFLSAEEEEGITIAQANAPIDEEGKFINPRIKSRLEADYPLATPEEVELMDVAPNQIASIAASLIPFLEHDDANRALMGSNMMRQAVPLLQPEAPVVGTGLEEHVVNDARIQIVAEGEGVVDYVDAEEIVIRYNRTEEEKFVSFDDDIKRYRLPKFAKTNQNTCVNLKPIVRKGQKVVEGQVLTDGYGTDDGELAIGRNLKVAFMPWKGYNFEDAIVISEHVVKNDVFTSIHIDEYLLEVRDTKRGLEELTPDIPNVSEEATKDLDENGLIRIGAHVKPGDILIGKITPKGESDPSPEEKLLRAIFGDKAGDVKDASLKASPSLQGVVINKKLFSRALKDKKSKNADKLELEAIDKEFGLKVEQLTNKLVDKLFILVNGKTSQGVKDYFNVDVIPKGTKFTIKMLQDINYLNINPNKWTTDKNKNEIIKKLLHNYIIKRKEIDSQLRRKKYNVTIGDELPTGIVQMAKVYIAKKRKVTVGDKMAGRHGNKGIVAKIVRAEDMPFLEDGTPVDIVLNPLGVPSRMNLGQIYETILGWAGLKLGVKYASPIFDGASYDQVQEELKKAGLPEDGRVQLYDGRTGYALDQQTTVGVMYMLKLNHLIEDKMHARSIGPYSLITQQPLGGKAQFGGQRLGEMEVWALYAYGASSILKEMLTVKSDDVKGRSKVYEAIVKGENLPEGDVPESFKVLLRELMGLGLEIHID